MPKKLTVEIQNERCISHNLRLARICDYDLMRNALQYDKTIAVCDNTSLRFNKIGLISEKN